MVYLAWVWACLYRVSRFKKKAGVCPKISPSLINKSIKITFKLSNKLNPNVSKSLKKRKTLSISVKMKFKK